MCAGESNRAAVPKVGEAPSYLQCDVASSRQVYGFVAQWFFTSERTRISHHVSIAMPAIFLCCHVVVVFDRSIVGITSSQWELMTVRREMCFKCRRGRVTWPGDVRKEEPLAQAITVDGCKESYCRFCSERNVWTRLECRRCKTAIPSVLQGKDMQASTKSGRSWSEWSSSGDGEDEVLAYEAQWAEETELRELREENQRLKNEGEKPSVQFEEPSEEVMCEEDEKMKVASDLNSKKKKDQRKREIVKQLRKIDESTDLPQELVGQRKEMWRQEMHDIEQRRIDLSPEHQQMQKLSQKRHCPQDNTVVAKECGQVGKEK